MTENRPAEAGEQLPEVIGEPVLPDNDFAIIRNVRDRLIDILGSAKFREQLYETSRLMRDWYKTEDERRRRRGS